MENLLTILQNTVAVLSVCVVVGAGLPLAAAWGAWRRTYYRRNSAKLAILEEEKQPGGTRLEILIRSKFSADFESGIKRVPPPSLCESAEVGRTCKMINVGPFLWPPTLLS